MKTLDRYIFNEFIESFIFGLLVFTGVLLLDQIFQLIDLLLSKGVRLLLVLKLFILFMPKVFSLTIPMAVLLGILLSYGRMSEDNEITAFKSAGLSYFSFTSPILIATFLLSLFLIIFNHKISPMAYKEFRNVYKQILEHSPVVKFEENSITNLGEYRIYVDKVYKKDNVIKNISIYKFTEDNGLPWRISATSSTVSVTPDAIILNLYKGYWQKPDPQNLSNLIHIDFKQYRFSIPINRESIFPSRSLLEMDSKDLRDEISLHKSKGMPTGFLETEYWLRWSLSLTAFLFSFIGIPIGILIGKGARSISFGISIIILFIFYIFLVIAINIGEKEYIAPRYILFLPNIVIFILGSFLWSRMLKR